MFDKSMEKILLALSVFLLFLPSASLYQLIVDDGPLSCFECNVWKAGYGHDCNAPRNRTGCFACMKVETTIFMGYYKNTPRYSTVISRVCAKTKAVAYTSGCQYYRTVDGHSRRCYCDTNNCNAATSQTISSFTILAVAAFVYYNNFISVFRRSL